MKKPTQSVWVFLGWAYLLIWGMVCWGQASAAQVTMGSLRQVVQRQQQMLESLQAHVDQLNHQVALHCYGHQPTTQTLPVVQTAPRSRRKR